MFLFTNKNSGYFLYFSNKSIQSVSFKGGSMPLNIFHSTIDNPDSVNLVKPPIKTIIKTKEQHITSHQ